MQEEGRIDTQHQADVEAHGPCWVSPPSLFAFYIQQFQLHHPEETGFVNHAEAVHMRSLEVGIPGKCVEEYALPLSSLSSHVSFHLCSL